MKNYRVVVAELSGNEFIVIDHQDGRQSWIPKDESNSDYQRYLRWLENPDAEEGGTLS